MPWKKQKEKRKSSIVFFVKIRSNEYMKRFVLLLAFIFLLIPQIINAQTPSPSPAILPSTMSCGISSDPAKNKCCNVQNPVLSVPNTGNVLFDGAMILVNGLKDTLLTPVINKLTGTVVQEIDTPCYEGVPSTPGSIGSSNCICLPNPPKSNIDVLLPLCDHADASGVGTCKTCISGGGVWTGIGCVQADIQSFIQDTLLRLGIGIAGGIAMLCIMFAAFQMQTSGGNAEKLKKAQELLTNCITGLMVIIFSTLILKIIGVDILKIPGFR